jgi:carbonic anhydrase
MAGNRRFVAGRSGPRDVVAARKELVSGQHPEVIVLACADSRVSPTVVFDKGLGDLFVVRTAGNVADAVALGSLEYAVEHLHSRVLLVMGHEKCGAVIAAVEGGPMPSRNLEAIMQRITPAVNAVRGRAMGDQLVALAVEANVRQSARDVVAQSDILRSAVGAGKLGLIQAVYRLATGEVVRLG